MSLKVRITNKTRSIIAVNKVKRKVPPLSTTTFEISISDLDVLRPFLLSHREKGQIDFDVFNDPGSVDSSDTELVTLADIPDVIPGGGGSSDALDISYDNTASGLTATNVKEAIDEVVSAGGSGTDNQTASEVPFTPAGNLTSTNTQAALEELDAEKIDVAHLGTGGAAHASATTSTAGFMSSTDKVKLNSIESGADVTDTANVTSAGALMRSGGTMTGNIVMSPSQTVDGRDLSVDGAKLDGIEPGADVTDASNVTLAGALMRSGGAMSGNISMAGAQTVDGRDLSVDGAKLDGIEPGADVTDTANVTSAGALMRSGGTMTGSISMAGAQTVDGRDLSADGAKLDGIEPGADVTDTANVNLAGALMRTGGTMTGDVVFSGSQTFDGRDVSVDGSKLDGIEPGAEVNTVDTVFGRTGNVVATAGDYEASEVSYDNTTSGLTATDVKAAIDEVAASVGGGGTDDQTAAEVPFTPSGNLSSTDVQDALEELDSEKLSTTHAGTGGTSHANATTGTAGFMSSGDKTKLNSIETNADVTDTANVTSAGALMRSGGTMTGNIVMSGAQTVDGRDLSSDGSKLDGIESGADVTDTANVTSAGALMRSGGTMTGDIVFNASQTFDGRDLSVDGSKLDGIEPGAEVNTVDTVHGRTGDIVAVAGDYSADEVSYDNATSGLTATDVKAAIDELAASGGGGGTDDQTAAEVPFTPAGNIAATDVQDAIEELDSEKLSATHAGTGGAAHSNATTGTAGFMSSGDKTKLDGIESGADVTDTANVTSAGALMRSGGTMTGNIVMSGSETVDGRDLSVDGAKLDGIETNADVTDTANVTSAGALMRSGGTMTGNIVMSGAETVDGRDLSVDGAKLDGIESGAEVNTVDTVHGRTGDVVAVAGDYAASEISYDNTTSGLTATDVKAAIDEVVASASTDDQTAAEVPFTPAGNIAATDVQDAIEELDSEKLSATHEGTGGASHANATTGTAGFMSSGDKTKLNSIESGADVTDTANVTSAGALMRSGGTMTGNIVMSGAETVDGRDLSVDGSKLDGIEPGAEVNTVDTVFGRTGNIIAVSGDYAASEVSYDNTTSGLTATDVKEAIDELAASGGSGTDDQTAAEVPFTPAGNISATDVQDAIEELDTEKLAATHEGTGGASHANATTGTAGFMSSGDKTKLDGIESGADVTDTANVTSAGALMRSGGTMTGDIVFNASQTFDGRDLSVDGAKLDGIDPGAEANTVDTVFGRTGDIVAVAGDYAASEVSYDNTTSGLTATDVKAAIDEVASSVTDDQTALEVSFTPSGNIAATDVQNAIEELDSEKLAATHEGTGGASHANATTGTAGFMSSGDKTKLDGVEAGADVTDTANVTSSGALMRSGGTMTGNIVMSSTETVDGRDLSVDGAKLDGIESGAEVNTVDTVFGRTGDVIAVAGDYAAEEVSYDNTTSGLTATDVKAAIDEVAASVGGGTDDQTAAEVPFTPAGNIAATDVQDAIEELDSEKLSATHEGTGGASHANATTGTAGFMSATDKVKLNGIESGADVTDTANVTSAGALMRSGGTMTGNIVMSGAQTVDGRDLSVDGAKLDGIESGAEINTVDTVHGRTGDVVAVAGDYSDSDISVDPSGFNVISSSATTQALYNAENDARLLDARSSGVRFFDGFGSTGGTTIAVGAGSGVTLDLSTDPVSYATPSWGAQTLTPPASQISFLICDSAGTLSWLSAEPTPSQRRTSVLIGTVATQGTTITAAISNAMPVRNSIQQLRDMMEGMGKVRLGTGTVPQPVTSTLGFTVTSGSILVPGISVASNPNNPHSFVYPGSASPASFQYATPSGSDGVTRTAIIPDQYWNGSTLVTIGGNSNRAAIHTIYLFPSSNIRVARPQQFYSSMSRALSALATRIYTTPAGYEANGFIVGYIIARRNATNLASSSDALFVSTNQFGGIGGGTAGIIQGVTSVNGQAGPAVTLNEFVSDVFRVQDNTDTTKKIAFNASAITTGTVRTITMPDADVDLGSLGGGGGVTSVNGDSGPAVILNEFESDVFRVQDNTDTTKKISFDASAITTGTVRTITMPDADVDLGSLGGGGGGPEESTGARDFSSANYYAGAAGTGVGNASGFIGSALVRINGSFAGLGNQVFFGNNWFFINDGGWYIGMNEDRFKFGVGQASDGVVLENFVNAELPSYNIYGRLFLVTLAYDGTDARGYVNGEHFVTLTPSGGYDTSFASDMLMLGRSNNGGAAAPSSACSILGAGYSEAVITESEVIDHFVACMESGAFEDLPTTGFENMYSFEGLSSAPATLSDVGSAADTDLTLNGSLTVSDFTTRW